MKRTLYYINNIIVLRYVNVVQFPLHKGIPVVCERDLTGTRAMKYRADLLNFDG